MVEIPGISSYTEYTSPLIGIKLTAMVVIGTDCVWSWLYNYVVIVCGLIGWKQTLYCLFIFVLSLNIHLSEEAVGIPSTGLTLPQFSSCPKPGPESPKPHVVFVFNGLRWEGVARFVDIGEFVYVHCLNFLSIILCKTRPHSHHTPNSFILIENLIRLWIHVHTCIKIIIIDVNRVFR